VGGGGGWWGAWGGTLYHVGVRPLILGLALSLVSLVPPGCASSPVAPLADSFVLAADRYGAAFQATKDMLREYEFELDRVDARRGVITTQRRQWAGLATPWIPHATGADSAIVGLLHHELRECRVTFTLADEPAPPDSPIDDLDLRAAQVGLRAQVQVTRFFIQRPHQRISAVSIRHRSQAIDPALLEEGLQPQFAVDEGLDAALAGRIAADIQRRIDENSVQTSATTEQTQDK